MNDKRQKLDKQVSTNFPDHNVAAITVTQEIRNLKFKNISNCEKDRVQLQTRNVKG